MFTRAQLSPVPGTWKTQLDCKATSLKSNLSLESKMQLKLSNCKSSNLSLGTFSRDLFMQLFVVLGSHMGAPVVARCQPHRKALRFSVVQPFYCSTHQVRGCSIHRYSCAVGTWYSIILCLGLPDSETSIYYIFRFGAIRFQWIQAMLTTFAGHAVLWLHVGMTSQSGNMGTWEVSGFVPQFPGLRQRPSRGPSRAGPSPSPVGRNCDIELIWMIWTSYMGTSWTCLWYLLLSPSSMGMVALCSCLDVFRCYVCMS